MAWVDFAVVFCFGMFGVHKFIEKKKGMGVLYLCTMGLFGIGWLYDCIKYLMAAIKGQRLIKGKGYYGKELKDNEPLPIVQSLTVPLQQDEVCHFVGNASYQTSKNVVTGYTGTGSGVNIRIAKGVSYRTGGHGSQAIRQDIVEKFPGTLTITNKRVVFTASKGSFDGKYSKISSVRPGTDGIQIQIGDKTYTLICNDSLYIYQIIMRASSNVE